jgi:hypothetical protein
MSKEELIKTETLGTLFSKFTKTIIEAINQSSRNRPTSSTSSATVNCNTDCNFCGKAHFIRDCDLVGDYIRAGKCKRNHEGKVVLPTGAFVPREIPGTLLRERIDEWHHRNPNQLAAATLVHTIGKAFLNPPTSPTSITLQPTYQLSASDRIATLEAELFNLRTRKPKFTPAVRTRAQKAREATIDEEDDEEDAAAVRAARQPRIEEVIEEPIAQPQTPNSIQIPTENVSDSQPVIAPEHPYRNAKDASYAN